LKGNDDWRMFTDYRLILLNCKCQDVCGGHSCFLINNYYKESSGNGPEIRYVALILL
jgi:hypothetical protein